MKAVLMIATGGALGALSRWGLAKWLDSFRGDSGLPLGIFVANVAGCLAFGWLYGAVEEKGLLSEALRLGIFTGFLGSLTTFSTFGWNTFDLLKSGQTGLAAMNVIASVVVGVCAVWAGYSLAR